jgi:hypothetical protein
VSRTAAVRLASDLGVLTDLWDLSTWAALPGHQVGPYATMGLRRVSRRHAPGRGTPSVRASVSLRGVTRRGATDARPPFREGGATTICFTDPVLLPPLRILAGDREHGVDGLLAVPFGVQLDPPVTRRASPAIRRRRRPRGREGRGGGGRDFEHELGTKPDLVPRAACSALRGLCVAIRTVARLWAPPAHYSARQEAQEDGDPHRSVTAARPAGQSPDSRNVVE